MMLSLLGFSYIAFGLLALAMFSHHREVLGKAPSDKQSRRLSITGWLGLALTYWGCTLDQGVAYGSIIYFGLLAASGLLVIMTLSYRAKFMPYAMALSAIFSTTLFVIR
ncbi:DUF3325 domain-containing protein [Shewanella sp. Choline-02u-19]|jgi:hypothetical protein|uniref:DUF3325 domain-containing protein n=1 Tax=unclassified Shewanella TaxID=196818 RepID=UPI000C339C32|nr:MULTISPECIES: DUF3325 domain-containing protein [unclassified Shewanella]PKG58061.1 DUF3325 domain-containing protein [Shewanella sp. GutDb-MelDb]PKG74019.1 DUF3325 domain-containing protein [Shewanella sp. GutCb]PKH55787.1 DUF3325 domain-containing protein [Shewanella sp. Bg11-22]PKI26799.1 DUF3325 domain-containing protein [Shewanella sp. Choline-02u-19]